jgi:hypothetical protein
MKKTEPMMCDSKTLQELIDDSYDEALEGWELTADYPEGFSCLSVEGMAELNLKVRTSVESIARHAEELGIELKHIVQWAGTYPLRNLSKAETVYFRAVLKAHIEKAYKKLIEK